MTKQSPRKTTRSSSSKRAPTSTNYIILGGVVVLGVIALGAMLFTSLKGDPGVSDIIQFPGLSRTHDDTMTYTGDLPPAGGAHFSVWQTCGVYDEVVNPGYGVHSLEHGAVWITYDPAVLPADQIAALQQRVKDNTYMLMSPFPDQHSPLVLTSWGSQLELESADDARVDEFIERYRLGPNTPEPGAACTGGNGQPLG